MILAHLHPVVLDAIEKAETRLREMVPGLSGDLAWEDDRRSTHRVVLRVGNLRRSVPLYVLMLTANGSGPLRVQRTPSGEDKGRCHDLLLPSSLRQEGDLADLVTWLWTTISPAGAG